eukprot:TRINITY_DN1481_c0_g2_i1.p1 TRINITY_DN1481_c0_g2~~TRINITY_DN1481_c0_g2_i1.p1  ORF type:complete len:362 (+),score=54.11 TRINITY_DN1481_c0_g2_i1:68-1087(+)
MQKVGAQIALLFTVLIVPGWWILAMQETGWASKVTAIYRVNAGLVRVSIKKGLVKIPFTGEGSMIAKYFGPKVETTAEFQEFCCGLSASMPMFSKTCGVGSVLHSTSVAMLLCILLGTIFMCVGAGLLALWQYDKPRESLRHWMRFFFAIGPVTFAAGTVQYMLLSGVISELPDITFQNTSVIGPCALISILLSVISCVPFFVSMVYVTKSTEEALNEHLSLMHKDAREESKLQNYMAAASGQEEGRPVTSASESYGQQPQQHFQSQPGQYNSASGPNFAGEGYGQQPQQEFQSQPGQYNSAWGPNFAPAPAGPGSYHVAEPNIIQAPAPASYAGQGAW